jgi:L-amino acid N-acyltransferase
MLIRDANPADAAGITDIYNDAVAHTTAIWNEQTVDVTNRQAWLADRNKAGYPVLVAVDGRDTVLGYASFGDWRAWDGYRHTVEHSVYVRGDQRGRGIGEALLRELMQRAQQIGKHVLVAGIEANNTASIKLHQKLGFQHAGHLHQVGTKFGRWLDLVFLQRILDDHAAPQGALTHG